MNFIAFLFVVLQILIINGVQPKETKIRLLKSRIGDEDTNLEVPEIIRKYGYPVEVHEVTTSDSYKLTIHRIPSGKNSTSIQQANKYAVWLQHGLLGDSSNWIFNNEEKALAYALADAGYDVWMGNSRGNRYSKKHATLLPSDEEFWNFGYHEMGIYDLPAGIDYVLAETGQSDLFYFGYSEGATSFFVLATELPEYNSKIRLMSALAPIAYTHNMISPFHALGPISNKSEEVAALFGTREFLPNSAAAKEFLGESTCKLESLLIDLCNNTLFLIGGYNSKQFDKTLINAIMGHTPSSTSVRNIIHFAQGINSTAFGQFNYGIEKNLQVYGQETPPKYDITKITCPVAIYWAEKDWLATPADIYRLTEQLSSLVLKHSISNASYNHLDFIWGIDNDNLLVKKSLEFMKYFLTPIIY